MAYAFTLTAIAAIGQTMVIITGGIERSVGSIMGLFGLSTWSLLTNGVPLLPAVIAGIVVGTLFGMCNGLLITQVGFPPSIDTLGALSIGRGLIYELPHGYPITPPRDEQLLRVIRQGYVDIVPVPVIMIGIVIIAGLFLGKTTLGRYINAVGGNEEAARLAGIDGWARPIAIVRAG